MEDVEETGVLEMSVYGVKNSELRWEGWDGLGEGKK